MSMTIYENETHEKITRVQTNQAVRNLVKELNLYGGSNGSIQLYELIGVYLLCPQAREEINQISEKYSKQGSYKLPEKDSL